MGPPNYLGGPKTFLVERYAASWVSALSMSAIV